MSLCVKEEDQANTIRIIVLPTEIAYLAGNPFKTDTPACVSRQDGRTDEQDTFGFLLTAALFTQHMWTLAIAIATFLLLVSLSSGQC